jgi:hypothetical protein
MNKNRLLMVIGFVFFFITINYLSNLRTLYAQECRIVRIHGGNAHPSLIIEPSTIFLSKGDCVVWFNGIAAGEVKVSIAEGKRCASVTNAPRGFSLLDEPTSCYVMNWMGFTGTASLRFMEKGTYKYVVEANSMPGVKVEGRVEVE